MEPLSQVVPITQLNILPSNNHVTLNILPQEKKRSPKWTLKIFLEKAYQTHNNRYDYSLIREEDLSKGSESRVTVMCHRHSPTYKWDVTATNHVRHSSGCPNCSGRLRLTVDSIIFKSKEIHGTEKFDYSLIMESHLTKGNRSRIPLKCNSCDNIWQPVVTDHLSKRKRGCPRCAGNERWNLTRFLLTSKNIHGDIYDYSYIEEKDVNSASSKVLILCRKFNHKFYQTIDSHIHKRSGCKHCSSSRTYSLKQIKWLEGIMTESKINIQYALSLEGEYNIKGIGKVDGFHQESGTIFEFHGRFWHGDPRRHDPGEINKFNGKTFEELYQRTLERDEKIRSMGYNLIVMWEMDFHHE